MSTDLLGQIESLSKQLADAKLALADERRACVERIQAIDAVLGPDPQLTFAPVAPRHYGLGVGQAILDFVAANPGSKTEAIVRGLADRYRADSVRGNIGQHVSRGRLAKVGTQAPFGYVVATEDRSELPEASGHRDEDAHQT